MTLLIHPGFHKTGTTWLQTEVFTDDRLFNTMFSHEDVDALIVRPHDFAFDPEPARQAIAARASRPGAGKIDVISSEIMVGSPFFGLREGRVIADRLKAIAPDARIMFTVRAQAPILRSLYQQYLKRGGTLKPAEFFDQQCEPGYTGFDPDTMMFHRFADHYAKLFGAERVRVMPQEILIREPDTFFTELVRFATGNPVPDGVTISQQRGAGVSPPMGGTPLFRVANRLRSTPLHPSGFPGLRGLGNLLFRAGYFQKIGSDHYTREVKDAIGPIVQGRYGASNRALQAYVPWDLCKLGYDIG